MLDHADACKGAPWIGILKQPAPPEPRQEPGKPGEPKILHCPDGWEWVFSSDGAEPPPGLQRFCRPKEELRRKHQQEKPRPQYRRIENPYVEYEHEFESFQQDCPIVGPAAETIFPPPKVAVPLRKRFAREAMKFAPEDPSTASGQARLVIVDSVQDDASPQGKECNPATKEGDYACSPHGEVLVKLAQDLLCPSGNCSVKVTARRVLRRTHQIKSASPPNPVVLELEDPAGETQGGSSGTLMDLATAIRREVEQWWKVPGRPRLVLNLSVGWEPIHSSSFGDLEGMVQAAIEDAVCRGALVIAAAGNRVTGPPELERPLLPAAWEQLLAPTPQQCELLLEESAEPAGGSVTPYRPLVFAVGGVQHDDAPLSNSRPNATPPLVAFGDHAPALYPVAPLGAPPIEPQRMKILTGTSVSTLVVSAAAAEHWRRNPSLASFDVMEDLRNGGQDTGLPVDFSLEPEADFPPIETARRVFVHQAFEPPPQEWPPKFDAAQMDKLLEFTNLPVQIDLPQCRPRALRSSALPGPGQNMDLCPQRLFDVRSQPWLGPQPGADHNPACAFSEGSPGTLVLEFDPCYRVEGLPARIDDLTLIVADQAYRLPLPKDGFLLGDPEQLCPQDDDKRRVQVVLSGFDFDPRRPMYLAVRVNGNYATLSPILQVIKEDE